MRRNIARCSTKCAATKCHCEPPFFSGVAISAYQTGDCSPALAVALQAQVQVSSQRMLLAMTSLQSGYNRYLMSEKRPEDLSVNELRRLLLNKRQVSRKDRLERFRRTGRVVTLASDADLDDQDQENVRLGRVLETPAGGAAAQRDSSVAQPGKDQRRLLMDRILLGVEILAIVGLIGVVLNGLSILRTLNQEVAASIQQPTPEATALITAVVLPSGHTPPNAPNGAQPNESEIPEHLRPLVQSLANIPIPTAGVQQAVRLQVPALSVDAPIVQGDGWEQLKKGAGQHIGTPDPGQNGNIVLSAHDDIFGEIFRNLDRLKPGDTVILYTNQRQYTYVVTGTQIVAPTQVEVMAPTPNSTVTLISCYPYLIDNQRIVVSAVLQSP
jgi:sortase A